MRQNKVVKKIIVTAWSLLLALTVFPGRVYAQETEKSGNSAIDDVVDQITTTAGDIYEQVDEALENVDSESLRGQVRAALEQMDAMGISPTAFARERLGIDVNPTAGIVTGLTGDLVESAERVVREESQGTLQDLFDMILGAVSDFVGDVAALIGEHISLPFLH